jgi:hypothetical protein
MRRDDPPQVFFCRLDVVLQQSIRLLLGIVRWGIPSCAAKFRSSPKAISIEPSIFCMLSCGRRCLSIMVIILSLLPVEGILYLGHLVDPFSSFLSLSFYRNTIILYFLYHPLPWLGLAPALSAVPFCVSEGAYLSTRF